MNSTVLITTAISPPSGVPFLKMTNPYDRIISTKSAIYFFVSQKVKNIVIADATGKKVLSDHELSEVAQTGTVIEQVAYTQDDEAVIKKGKGFAEGSLINFAVDNSTILSQTDSFFKCTGKVLCRNFSNIVESIEKYNKSSRKRLSSVFWNYYELSRISNQIDLRFYYTNKDFLLGTLIPAYMEADDLKGQNAEESCARALSKRLTKGTFFRPKLTGFCGGHDTQYDEINLGDLELRFPCFYQFD